MEEFNGSPPQEQKKYPCFLVTFIAVVVFAIGVLVGLSFSCHTSLCMNSYLGSASLTAMIGFAAVVMIHRYLESRERGSEGSVVTHDERQNPLLAQGQEDMEEGSNSNESSGTSGISSPLPSTETINLADGSQIDTTSDLKDSETETQSTSDAAAEAKLGTTKVDDATSESSTGVLRSTPSSAVSVSDIDAQATVSTSEVSSQTSSASTAATASSSQMTSSLSHSNIASIEKPKNAKEDGNKTE